MKTINSIVGLTLALGMTLAIPFSSSAIEPANQKTTIEALAYRNIDNAKDLAEYNSILAARNTLIYGDQSWTIDGAVKVFNADGTVEELPDFYDLFPSDWEPGKLPDAESNTANSIFNNIPQPWNERSSALYYGNTYFNQASNEYGTDPFAYKTLPRDGDIGIYPESIPDNATSFNAGFYDADTRRGLGWASSLSRGKGAFLSDAKEDTRYGFIVSVNRNPGYGYVLVDSLDSDSFPVDVRWVEVAP